MYSRPVTAAYPESSSGASVATPPPNPPTSCTTPTPPTPVLRVNKYKTLLKRERLKTFRLKRQVHHLQNAKIKQISHLSHQSQLFIHHKAYSTTQSDIGSLFLPQKMEESYCLHIKVSKYEPHIL